RFTEFVEHDDELAALDLLHLTGGEVANPAREFVANLGALALAHPLDNPLFGCLEGSASELGEVDGNLHLVADLEVRILVAGLLERGLAARVGPFLDYGLVEHDV